MNLSHTDISVPGYALTALKTLNTAGFEAYAVGGCVRDMLLGKTPDDWDITTSALPEQTKAVFSDRHIIETGLKHGTVTVRIDGHSLEITTFRTDGEYTDHRHPGKVTFSGRLENDLSRRDFTINAMCLSAKGEITDLFGGINDLEKGVIRCVGDPEKRFDEDALRILRCIRFASTLGFSVEKNTAAAIHAQKKLLEHISAERIFAETKKTLTRLVSPEIQTEFRDVWETLFPEMTAVSNSDFTAAAGKTALTDDKTLSIALFLSMLSSGTAATVLKRLKADNSTFNTVLFLIENKASTLESKAAALRLIARGGMKNATALLSFRKILNPDSDQKILAGAINDVENGLPLRPSQLALRGDKIAALGFKGKQIGKVSAELLEAVFDGRVENRENPLYSYLKNNFTPED